MLNIKSFCFSILPNPFRCHPFVDRHFYLPTRFSESPASSQFRELAISILRNFHSAKCQSLIVARLNGRESKVATLQLEILP